MSKLASSDLGRLVKLRNGDITRIRTTKTNIISASAKDRFQHSPSQGGVYDSGYASAAYGASGLSPADIMMLSDVDPVTGGFLDSFTQNNLTSAGIHGENPSKWAGDMPVPAMPNGFSSTPRACSMTHIRPQFPQKIREVKIRLLLFSVTAYSNVYKDVIFGSPGDTNGAGAASRDKLAFQCGINTKLTNSYNNIPARNKVFTFSGQNYCQHDYTANAAWLVNTPWMDSDELDLGDWYDTFDAYLSIQPEAAYQGTGGVVPTTFVGCNYFPRYEFEYNYINAVAAPLNGIKGKGGNYDLALDAFPTPEVPAAFLPTGFPTTTIGGAAGYAPMFMYKINGEWKTFAGDGDSMTAGVGDGQPGSGPDSCVRGSSQGNVSYIQRVVREKLKRPFVNLGRAQDGAKHKNVAANWFCRRALLADLGVDVILSNTGTNDVAVSVTYPSWAISTAKLVNDVVSNANGCYICVQAGTTAGSGTGPTGTGTNIVDNTVRWKCLWTTTTSGDKAAMVACAVNATMKAALPNCKIYSYALPPGSASPGDQFRTTERQTVSTNYEPGGPRSVLNDRLRNLQCYNDGFIDPNAWGIEHDYGKLIGFTGGSGKWASNGTPFNLTFDGLHYNGNAFAIIVANHPVKPFLDVGSAPELFQLAA